jgi:WD40 repeat protein
MSQSPDREGQIVEALLGLPPEQRGPYLEQACAGDPSLRKLVRAMLQAHEQGAALLDRNLRPEPQALVAPSFHSSEKPGDRIGRYKLLQQIGEGGCGVVYMAEQEIPVKRKVALKVIKLGMDTRQVIARFEAERQALALMDHPNIAKVLDGGATETGRPYFVMELVRGTKITKYCDDQKFPMQQRLNLFIQVCQAVQHAHQKGIIHRDLKPSNILITVIDGVPVPKVIDFGIAKATQGRLTDRTLFTAFEQFLGTPAYMSPEQAAMSGVDIDTRSDIYSLGVLLYELLTGKTPFETKILLTAGVDEMRRIIREREPVPPSTRLGTMLAAELTAIAEARRSERLKLVNLVRGDLDWIVMKCLEKERGKRYETANGLAMDVKRHLGNEPIVARPPSKIYRLNKLIKRNKLILSASGALILMLIGSVVVSTSEALRATKAERHSRNSETRVSRELARSYIERGMGSAAEGKLFDSLPWFLRGLELEQNEPERVHMHTARLISVLNDCPKLYQVQFSSRPFTDVAFDPSGQLLATASADGTARTWDVTTGAPVSRVLRHDAGVFAVKFSKDGLLVATAGLDHSAKVWNARTGDPVSVALRHESDVIDVDFSPDGRFLVSSSKDKTARVWDLKTGKEFGQPLVHDDWVVHANFSADGLRIVTASFDGTARVWDAHSGLAVSPPLSHKPYGVHFATMSPDGTCVLTVSIDYSARVWGSDDWQPRFSVKHNQWVTFGTFSRDGTKIVTASHDNTARVWDARTGRPLTPPLAHGLPVIHAAFSSDGRFVATASLDRTACVWDVKAGQRLVPPLKHLGKVNRVSFSADSRFLATASDDGCARVWDLVTERNLLRTLKHNNHVCSVCFLADGSRVVTGGGEGSASIWNEETGERLATLPHSNWVTRVGASPDGTRIVTVSQDATAVLWDVSSLRQPKPTILKHQNRLTDAKFSPDGRRVVTASLDGTAGVWDSASGQPLVPALRHRCCVRCAIFSPDGGLIATGSGPDTGTGEARVWDSRSGLPMTDPIPVSAYVSSVSFDKDGERLLTTTVDGQAMIWDAHTGRALVPTLKHGDSVCLGSFSPDGSLVLTASSDGFARIWDSRTGVLKASPLPHSAGIMVARFSHDGRLVLTAGLDGSARIWDAGTGEPITAALKHEGSLLDAAFSEDDTKIITAGTDSQARIWRVPDLSATVPEIDQISRALSGQAIDSSGRNVPLSKEQFLETWALIQAKGKNCYTNPIETIKEWHLSQSSECEAVGKRGIAAVHLKAILKVDPENKLVQDRLNRLLLELKNEDQASGKNPIPSRGIGLRPELVDLSNFYNAALSEDWQVGGEGNDLQALPLGTNTIAGVQFDIRGLIQLNGGGFQDGPEKLRQKYPEKVQGIRFNQKCRRVHFLHGAGWDASDGAQIGSFAFHYNTGEILEVPIIYGRHVRNWWGDPREPLQSDSAVLAWTGTNAACLKSRQSLRLYRFTWQNPFPQAEIQTISFKSTMNSSAPFLIAITVE